MRSIAPAALLIGIVALAGCGGGEEIPDPSNLAPLTQEQVEAIQEQDEMVAEEEGTPVDVPKEYQANRVKRQ